MSVWAPQSCQELQDLLNRLPINLREFDPGEYVDGLLGGAPTAIPEETA